MERSNSEYKSRFEYVWFTEEEARRDIYKYSKALAEYIRNNKIENLILPDTSARPVYVGLFEYLSKKYPEEKKPNTYFINPTAVDDSIDGITVIGNYFF